MTEAASCAGNSSGHTTFDQIRDGGATKYAVQFTLASQCDVAQLSAELNKYSSPTNDMQLSIYTDVSTLPDTSIVDATVPNADVSVYPTFTSVTADAVACLEPGDYWFVVQRIGSGSGDFEWGGSAGSGSYTKAVYAGGSWSPYTVAYDVDYTDFIFNVEDGGSACGAGGGGGGPVGSSTVEITATYSPADSVYESAVLFLASFAVVIFYYKK